MADNDNIVTIPKHWLECRDAPLSRAQLIALDDALRFSRQLE